MKRITTIEEPQYEAHCFICEARVNARPDGTLLPHRKASIYGKSEWCPGAGNISTARKTGRVIIRDKTVWS